MRPYGIFVADGVRVFVGRGVLVGVEVLVGKGVFVEVKVALGALPNVAAGFAVRAICLTLSWTITNVVCPARISVSPA